MADQHNHDANGGNGQNGGNGSGLRRRGPLFQPSKQFIMSRRRALVAQLNFYGKFTLAEKVEKFKEYGMEVSESMILRDEKFLKACWQREAAWTTDQHLRRELAKLDELEMFTVDALEQGQFAEPERYVMSLIQIMKRRARLLGLDKHKVEILDSGSRVSRLSDEELERVVQGDGDEAIQ